MKEYTQLGITALKQIYWQNEITMVFVFNSLKPSCLSFRVSEAAAVMTAGHREEREASEMNRE